MGGGSWSAAHVSPGRRVTRSQLSMETLVGHTGKQMCPWHTASFQYCPHPLRGQAGLLEASRMLGNSFKRRTGYSWE